MMLVRKEKSKIRIYRSKYALPLLGRMAFKT